MRTAKFRYILTHKPLCMKKMTSMAICLCIALGAISQTPEVLTQFITYKVNIKLDKDITPAAFTDTETIYDEMNNSWYVDKLPPAGYHKFVSKIHQDAMSGKITVYDPYFYDVEGETPHFNKIPIEEVRSIGIYTDTIRVIKPSYTPPYDTIAETWISMNEFNISTIVQIEFMEKWTINPENNHIAKEIIAYAPICKRHDFTTSEYRGLTRMYWILCR